MLTSNQQTVFNWINDDLELPLYAEAYKGALEQLNKKSPGYITFISHAGRDLMNGLASAAKGIQRQQVQYVNLVDDFRDEWKDEWGGEGYNTTEDNVKISGWIQRLLRFFRYNTTEDNDEKGHLIPNDICMKIQELVDEHKKGRLRAEGKVSLFYTIFLDYPNKESIPENLSKEWRKTKDFFEDHAHLRKKGFSMEAPNDVKMHFQYLDNLLYAAAASELEQLRSIHDILEKANQ